LNAAPFAPALRDLVTGGSLGQPVAKKAMTTYGHARVGTAGQTLAAQAAELHKAGAMKVCGEKISGAATRHPQVECCHSASRLATWAEVKCY
jgi:hypothetical protein